MKEIPEHPLYCVTKDGQVWSKPRSIYKIDKLGRKTFHGHQGKRLKPGLNCMGYYSVNLYDNPGTNKHKNYLVHRLVLETFIGPRPKGMECRHLNGIRTDNRLDNLCWGTRAENQQDSVKHGTHGGMGVRGEKHHNSKLSDLDRRIIIYMYSTGLFSQREIAKEYDITHRIIGLLVRGKIFPFVEVTRYFNFRREENR